MLQSTVMRRESPPQNAPAVREFSGHGEGQRKTVSDHSRITMAGLGEQVFHAERFENRENFQCDTGRREKLAGPSP